MMFENVIAGVDGRPGGRDAIALARVLLSPQGRLALAHVSAVHGFPGSTQTVSEEREWSVAPASPTAAPASPTSAPTRPRSGGEGRRGGDALALLERERDAAGVEAELMSVRASSPGRGLHELAEREHADVLALGSSHRGFLGRVLLGDDTRAALEGAPCAVAVAPAGYTSSQHSIATIGVGYDGSAESVAALARARELADALGAKVRVLQVVQVIGTTYLGYGGAALGAAIATMLADAEAEVAGLEGVEGEAVVGLPGEALAELGEHVDLLIVGSRGYGPVRYLILGSTSRHLVRHARCPLLVLPRTDQK
jgi:nucleotide-binding universal stress UspA family protein